MASSAYLLTVLRNYRDRINTVYYYYEYRDSAYRYWMCIFDRNGKRIETIDLSGEVHILTDHNDKYIHHIYPSYISLLG